MAKSVHTWLQQSKHGFISPYMATAVHAWPKQSINSYSRPLVVATVVTTVLHQSILGYSSLFRKIAEYSNALHENDKLTLLTAFFTGIY